MKLEDLLKIALEKGIEIRIKPSKETKNAATIMVLSLAAGEVHGKAAGISITKEALEGIDSNILSQLVENEFHTIIKKIGK